MDNNAEITQPMQAGAVENAPVAEVATVKNPSEVLLEVKNLKKYFPAATNFFGKPVKFLKAVDGISFTLKKGKTLGIVGESGCGKSTMGRSLLRLYDGVEGEILFEGQDMLKLKTREFDKIRPNMQMIFQDPYASLSPRLTVGEIIGESARQHKLVDKAGFHNYVLNVMNMCGLQPHYFERYPHEFSGGQRQRICIARALALKPKLVVCDEPVSALDVSIQAQVINMLIELREKLGLTYIFISHDLSVVKHISDDVGVMYLGNLVEYGSKEKVFGNTLHPYTKALFSAVPVPNPHVKMNRIMLKGDIPSPVNPPKGCKFHTRCEHCMEICSRIAPEYREIEEGHFCACHLYNSAEDNERLLEQAAANDEIEKELAEKEAKKPWNVVKTKVAQTVKNIFKKKDKSESEESAPEQCEEKPATISEEVAAIEPSAVSPVSVEKPAEQVEQPIEEKIVDKVTESAAAEEKPSENGKVDGEIAVADAVVAEEKPAAEKTTTAKKSSGTTVKKTTTTTATTVKKTTATANKPAAETAAKKTTTAKTEGTAAKNSSSAQTTAKKTATAKTSDAAAKKPSTAKKTGSTVKTDNGKKE